MAGHVQVFFSPCVFSESPDVVWRVCVEVGALLGRGCPSGSQWQQKGERGSSPSLSSHSFQRIKDDYSLFWFMELLSVLPNMRIYSKLSKSLKKEGSRGTFVVRGTA